MKLVKACMSFFMLLALSVMPSSAEKLSAKQILQNSAKQYSTVQDYSVDAKITAKSKSMHIPEMNLKVFFKNPDKLHIESTDGFAVLPRQGAFFGNPVSELLKSSEIVLGQPGRVMGEDCYSVKVTLRRNEGPSDSMDWRDEKPMRRGTQGITSTVWIDKKDFLVRQTLTTSEYSPSVKVRITYRKIDNRYWMPDTTQADISASPIPNINNRMHHGSRRNQPMTVTMKFSNYKVNTGLDDKLFDTRK